MSYTQADLEAAWNLGVKYGKLEAELEAIHKEVKRIAMKYGFEFPDKEEAA